jgi:hypothetical protein
MGGFVLLNILLIAGILVLILALITYQIQKIEWLRHHGKRVIAMVTSIRHETGETAAGFVRDNYYVTATWTNPRSGKTYSFWTWVINRCPDYRQGSLVPVLIDPDHPQRYILDL